MFTSPVPEETSKTTLISAPELSALTSQSNSALVETLRAKREYLSVLPTTADPFTDIYFIRSAQVLEAAGLNPVVRAQVFSRKAGITAGIAEALAIIEKYSPLVEHGGRVAALPDGVPYAAGEPLMLIEAPVLDIIKLETMYLGAIAHRLTERNMGISDVDLKNVKAKADSITEQLKGTNKEWYYVGARHWSWREDEAISRAAYAGGSAGSTTLVGTSFTDKSPVGSMPHALEACFALKYGRENAVFEATRAMVQHGDPKVPKRCLVDFNNHEIDDALKVARELGKNLSGFRIDTCGENIAQGGVGSAESPEAQRFLALGIPEEDKKYWFGRGVTVSAVYALRTALNDAGFADKKLMISSGFASQKKLGAFLRAEKILGIDLFDSVQCGGLYPTITTTMDIVNAADSRAELDQHPVNKVGREYRPNPRLITMLGEE